MPKGNVWLGRRFTTEELVLLQDNKLELPLPRLRKPLTDEEKEESSLQKMYEKLFSPIE